MESNSENFHRASSLPPSCVKHESRICELNVSFESPSKQTINNTSGEICHAMDEFVSCPRNVHDNKEIDPTAFILHSVKVSPNDSSGITDEDSGYCQTNSTSSRQVGSSNSIATSGQLNYDGIGSFVNRDELLQVMTEDLVDWFIQMYPSQTEDLTVDNFFDRLSDGVLLCYHVSELYQRLTEHCEISVKGGKTYLVGVRIGGSQAMLPSRCPIYQTRGLNSSNATSAFVSRDNVSNFLAWCRQLGMPDSVLFESEDLVCRKNPRNVAVCLLELARLGGGVGMAIPDLIQLEVEIDEELACECYEDSQSLSEQSRHAHSSSCSSLTDKEHANYLRRQSEGGNRSIDTAAEGCANGGPSLDNELMKGQVYRTTRSTELRRLKNKRLHDARRATELTNGKHDDDIAKKTKELQRPVVDMRSLDEIVRELLSQCTCKQTFPMIRVSEGRYLFGDKCTQIFVRILRNHVMVRVGGGWDTLNHFLTKYDECRKVNPPNYRVATEACVNSTTPRALDTANPEAILNVLNVTDNVAPLPQNSPIRGQGKLNAVKKSPPLEEDVTAKQSNRPCTNCTHEMKQSNESTHRMKETNLQSEDKSNSDEPRPKGQIEPGQIDIQNKSQPRIDNGLQVKPSVSSSDCAKPKIIGNALVKRNGYTTSAVCASRLDTVQQSSKCPASVSVSNRQPVATDRNGTQTVQTVNKKNTLYNRYKPSNATGDRQSSMARRALASAPRTPASNRSRNTSPRKLHSTFSKSSSSLVPCSTASKKTSFKDSVANSKCQSGRRISEQSDLLSMQIVDQPTGSIKASSTNNMKPSGLKLPNPTSVISNGQSYPAPSKTIQNMTPTSASNQTVKTSDIPLFRKIISPSRLQQSTVATEQQQQQQQQTHRTERRASLIPRLISYNSTPSAQLTIAQESDFTENI